MTTESVTLKGNAFHLANSVDYADDSVVSKTLLKKTTGNITLFAFDAGQGLSEHTAPYDALVHVIEGTARITIFEGGHEVINPAALAWLAKHRRP